MTRMVSVETMKRQARKMRFAQLVQSQRQDVIRARFRYMGIKPSQTLVSRVTGIARREVQRRRE